MACAFSDIERVPKQVYSERNPMLFNGAHYEEIVLTIAFMNGMSRKTVITLMKTVFTDCPY